MQFEDHIDWCLLTAEGNLKIQLGWPLVDWTAEQNILENFPIHSSAVLEYYYLQALTPSELWLLAILHCWSLRSEKSYLN